MQVHAYVAILRMPTELRLVQAYYGYGRPRQQLRAYYCYGYGRRYCYGYGRTTTMATGVLRLRLRAYYNYGYGRTTTMATGVLRLRLRAYYDYGYGRTTTMATGVLRLRLRANVRAYYVNFFTAYTVCPSYSISHMVCPPVTGLHSRTACPLLPPKVVTVKVATSPHPTV